jgi:UDP-N-acetylglucosamine diphosphorylase / glucose-1-phosphate thymidylyltransferase / UDP-N-acetylgalactosamine diphosphorylase / glucosamine-1-phosphate N-acetyltransferase / galactosamine-1-phosphate N-acetyltransferase
VTTPALYLFDDHVARDWQPFTLTRPAGELMLGAHTFRHRAELLFGMRCAGHVAAAALQGFEEPGAAPVADPAAIDASAPRLFLSSRAVPAWRGGPVAVTETATLLLDGHVVGCVVAVGEPTPPAEWFAAPQPLDALPGLELKGGVIDRVWDLVARNPEQLERDVRHALDQEHGRVTVPAGVHLLGQPDAVMLGSGVSIEPGVVLDARDGPIWLDDDVTVRAFTRLAGPAYVGRGSTLLGGPYTAVSVGPVCKVHGEIEETVVLGYSNKAHDGFLGHAYLGRWVNLGAMTTNSDLKNNYGGIRMWTPQGDADTGLMKLGCLLGDYVKTGIGSLLNTGTVVGAGSNIYGSAMPPKYVPPFSWGTGSELVAFDEDKFIALTSTVMTRRGLELADGMGEMLRRAWHLGRQA